MIKLKFYGTGGQGVVTASKILSTAVSIYEDQYAITVPAYGHERRGAPVNTSIIVDKAPVLVNSFVYDPDIVLVMDPSVIEKNVNVAEGIKKNSVLVLNTASQAVLETYKGFGFSKILYTDGTQIALNVAGQGIPNGSMLGALAATGMVQIESVEKAILDTWRGKAGDNNARAARKAFETIGEA